LNDAAVALAPTDTLRETVAQASDVGRQALAEMQRMLGVLRGNGPAELAPQPGTAQLSDLIAIVRSAGMSVQLAVTGDTSTLAPGVELAVYRIVQESLTNVLKHATNVTRVVVEVTYDDNRITIRVQNDGDPVTAGQTGDDHAPSGHGLAGMRERAALYGGHVQTTPAHGGGWIVAADLPIPIPTATR
ncbi:MAG: sensor histidine kinase, partial [Mycobacterium sp.]